MPAFKNYELGNHYTYTGQTENLVLILIAIKNRLFKYLLRGTQIFCQPKINYQ